MREEQEQDRDRDRSRPEGAILYVCFAFIHFISILIVIMITA
jgi:hypothetical protein